MRKRETQMSHFARPQKSRRVQEMARLGRPIGFAAWSNEENRVRKEKKNRRNTTLSKGKGIRKRNTTLSKGEGGMIFQIT